MHRSNRHERITAVAGITAAASLLGGIALLEKPHKQTDNEGPLTPIEQSGGRHGVKPHIEIGTAITARKVGDHYVVKERR
jgi:hypothetical protein